MRRGSVEATISRVVLRGSYDFCVLTHELTIPSFNHEIVGYTFVIIFTNALILSVTN